MKKESVQQKRRWNISIKHKLFLTMLVGACTLVLCLFLLIQWSFNRGFLQYANTMEQQRFALLAENIESDYADHGNWDFLRDNIRHWLKLLVSSAPEQISGKKYLRRIELEIRSGRFYSGEQLLPGMSHIFESRVYLLDAQQQPIFGPRLAAATPSAEQRTIRHDGTIVGYLGLIAGEKSYSAQQLHFLNKQMLEFNIAAGIMILIAASCSLPLAHLIVRPVNKLAAAVRSLAMGRFDTRAEHHSRDELGQFARDFNFMAMTLENNRSARRQFFADISHELRTPLAVLQAKIEAIQDGVQQATPDTLAILHKEVTYLNNMVNDLSELALSDIGAFSYQKIRLDLGRLLTEKVDFYRPEFRHKEISLECGELTDRVWPVFADPQRLRQLFGNLLENSLKYTSPGGQLRIDLQADKNSAVLHLQDSAPGVAEEEIPHLFENFYRADEARSRTLGGTGLGLTICRKIVAAHNGTIDIKQSQLGGLWVQVTLPMDG